MTPWKVSGSGRWFFASSSTESAATDGSPRRDWVGMAGHADDVAEVEVELARPGRVGEHLDPAGAVDEVEEDELARVRDEP